MVSIVLLTLSNIAVAQSGLTQASDGSWQYTGSGTESGLYLQAEYDDFDITFVPGPYIYSGNPIKLAIDKVTYPDENGNDVEIPSTDYRLEEGDEHDILYIKNNGGGEAQFWLTYTDNNAIGEATLSITNPTDATNIYSKTITFDIQKAYFKITNGSAETKYATLGDAINALTANVTLTMLDDYTVGTDETIGSISQKNIKFDCNGTGNYTLNLNEHTLTISAEGSLTISGGIFSSTTAIFQNFSSKNLLATDYVFYDNDNNMYSYIENGTTLYEKYSTTDKYLIDKDGNAITYAEIDQKSIGYAVLSDNTDIISEGVTGKTLTFKYGIKPDGAYKLVSGWNYPSWYNIEEKSAITQVVFDESFQYARPTSCCWWFSGFSNLKTITDIKYLNTENVTAMINMFAYCSKLTVIDVSNFDIQKVLKMNWMFYECTNLTTLDLSKLKTDIVTDMGAMFYNCNNLTILDLRGFNTVNVTDMGHLFYKCKKLTTVLIDDNWSTDAVTTSGYMFSQCSSLIGSDGTKVGSIINKTYAHADAGGYLTKYAYKIFYKWADDATGAYKTQYSPSSYSGETDVNIDNPNDREYDFFYWTQVSTNGEQIGGSSANLTIPAGKGGNRIYVMHWAIPQPYAEISDNPNGGKKLTFKYGVKPYEAYDIDKWASIPDRYKTNGSTTEVLGWDSMHDEITEVVFDENFAQARPVSCQNWFYDFTNLTTITGIEYLNTSEVTSMRGMFDKCKSLESIDLSHFNTGELISMRAMFCDCGKLTTLDLSSFNTEKVKEAPYMFQNCKKLTTILIDENNWSLPQSTSTQILFENCTEIIGNDGTKLGSTINATKAHAGTGGYLTKGDYKIFYKWADDASGVYKTHTPSSFTFSSTENVEIPVPIREGYGLLYWTQVSASGEQIGESSTSLTIAAGEVGNRIYVMHWGVPYAVMSDNTDVISEGVTGKTLTFKCSATKPDDAYDLNTADNNPDWMNSETSQITRVVFDKSFQNARPTSCHGWFFNFVALSEIVGMKEYLNTENVTNMQEMFQSCIILPSLDVSNFNTGSVECMRAMFAGSRGLTTLDVSNFDTEQVTDMANMFAGCSGLTTLNLSNFNTTKVTKMEEIFYNCSNLTTILITENKWDVSNLEEHFRDGMFSGCPELIGNYGTKVINNVGPTNAHANPGGYLTTGNYKIFYDLDADDGEVKLETFDDAITEFLDEEVTLENPTRTGYTFGYWTGTPITGLVDGSTASTVTIAANEVGNRIYTAHWVEIPYAIKLPAGWTAYAADDTEHTTPLTTATAGTKIVVKYDGTTPPVAKVEVSPIPEDITITNDNPLALSAGETAQLDYTITPAKAGDEYKVIKWTSSKKSVATVSSEGEVTAVAAGTATITVTINGQSATITVNVTE